MPDSTNRLHIYADANTASQAVAREIARLVRIKPKAVLGLATGNTPLRVYQELVRQHQQTSLSFKGVTVFNLDEYYPMEPESQYSYSRYMRRSLFGGINIDPANCHIPLAIYGRNAEIESRCANYERAIHDAGGIDLQLLGIGRNGHIGFNEPGSDKESRTRRVELALSTREAAINEFGSLEQVPQEAVTMGIGTILECKRAILLATGKAKAEAILAALAGPESSGCPASFLQSHDTTYHLDPAAASELPPEILVQASYHNAIGGGPSVRTVALPGPS